MQIGSLISVNLTKRYYYTSLDISINMVTNLREHILDNLNYHRKQLQYRLQQMPLNHMDYFSNNMIYKAFWVLDSSENQG